jgi:hypothetical protein
MTSFKLKPLSEVQSQLEHSTSLNQTQNLQDSSIISFYQSNQEQFLIREAKIMQTINPPQYYDKNVGLSFQIQHKCDITKVKFTNPRFTTRFFLTSSLSKIKPTIVSSNTTICSKTTGIFKFPTGSQNPSSSLSNKCRNFWNQKTTFMNESSHTLKKYSPTCL